MSCISLLAGHYNDIIWMCNVSSLSCGYGKSRHSCAFYSRHMNLYTNLHSTSPTFFRLPHGSKSSSSPHEPRRYIGCQQMCVCFTNVMTSLAFPSSLRRAVAVEVMDLTSLLCLCCRCELRMLSSLLMKRNVANKMLATRDVLYIIAPAYWVALHHFSRSRVH